MMSKPDRKNWAVVGGGFQGIAAAYTLAKLGQSVTIIEKANELGAVLNSMERNGLFLDLGCHLFANSNNETTEMFLEIMDGKLHPVHVKYASIGQNLKVDGIEVMDFTDLPEEQKARAVSEIIDGSSSYAAANDASLGQIIKSRFGETLAPHIGQAVHKITTHHPDTLDGATLQKLPLTRIRILDDEPAMELKKNAALDAILAVPSQDDPLRFYRQVEKTYGFRNFYPSHHGMKGFCEQAVRFFQNCGVTLMTGNPVRTISYENETIGLTLSDGNEIYADHMVWALDPGLLDQLNSSENRLSAYALNVPLVLYFFLVPGDTEVNYTYWHDYSPDQPVYRLSSPGFYGKQINDDGFSYLCAEVPTPIGSVIWENPEGQAKQIWSYAREFGMTQLAEPTQVITMKTPVSYPLNGAGFSRQFAAFKDEISKSHPQIILSDPNAYGKNDIAKHFKAEVEAVLV